VKALALTSRGHLTTIDTPVPVPADDQVLIKTSATTICTSDLIDIDHNPSNLAFPTVLGHEGSGTIVKVGNAVRGFEVGQKVATHPVHPCNHCVTCAAGHGHLCPNMLHFGLNMPGTFAEYYLARPDRIRATSVEAARACLAEPLSVCLEALEQARLTPNASLLIIGDGPFGIIMTRVAKQFQLRCTVLAGWSSFRLGFAPNAVTVNTKGQDNPVQMLLAANNNSPYDAVILAVGSSQAVCHALHCLKPKGRVVLFSGFLEPVQLDLNLVHFKELELVGACNDQDRFDEAVKLLSDESWSDLITHRFPFNSFEHAFELVRFRKDECLKVALEFSEQP
jgi:threonine dehydrogenase-like Zn-dependent dehydrogenase